ncbi:MAG: hypothetical protein ABIC95_04130 [archaeon]
MGHVEWEKIIDVKYVDAGFDLVNNDGQKGVRFSWSPTGRIQTVFPGIIITGRVKSHLFSLVENKICHWFPIEICPELRLISVEAKKAGAVAIIKDIEYRKKSGYYKKHGIFPFHIELKSFLHGHVEEPKFTKQIKKLLVDKNLMDAQGAHEILHIMGRLFDARKGLDSNQNSDLSPVKEKLRLLLDTFSGYYDRRYGSPLRKKFNGLKHTLYQIQHISTKTPSETVHYVMGKFTLLMHEFIDECSHAGEYWDEVAKFCEQFISSRGAVAIKATFPHSSYRNSIRNAERIGNGEITSEPFKLEIPDPAHANGDELKQYYNKAIPVIQQYFRENQYFQLSGRKGTYIFQMTSLGCKLDGTLLQPTTYDTMDIDIPERTDLK